MKISGIEIKRDGSLLQVENWPEAISETINETLSVEGEVDIQIGSESNVTVLNIHSSAKLSMPVCKDGVCQLGDWKPRRNVA